MAVCAWFPLVEVEIWRVCVEESPLNILFSFFFLKSLHTHLKLWQNEIKRDKEGFLPQSFSCGLLTISDFVVAVSVVV